MPRHTSLALALGVLALAQALAWWLLRAPAPTGSGAAPRSVTLEHAVGASPHELEVREGAWLLERGRAGERLLVRALELDGRSAHGLQALHMLGEQDVIVVQAALQPLHGVRIVDSDTCATATVDKLSLTPLEVGCAEPTPTQVKLALDDGSLVRDGSGERVLLSFSFGPSSSPSASSTFGAFSMPNAPRFVVLHLPAPGSYRFELLGAEAALELAPGQEQAEVVLDSSAAAAF